MNGEKLACEVELMFYLGIQKERNNKKKCFKFWWTEFQKAMDTF